MLSSVGHLVGESFITSHAISHVTDCIAIDGVTDHVVIAITGDLLNDVFVTSFSSITLLHLRQNVITFKTLLHSGYYI